MTKELELSNGMTALVDDADYEFLRQWRWHYTKGSAHEAGGYAARWVKVNGRQKRVYMHKQVLGQADGFLVDHVNRNTLDNRKINLRHGTASLNGANKIAPRSIVPFRGVQKLNRGGWQAKIRHSGKKHCLGSFPTPEEAARAYDAEARRAHGAFAILNFPDN